MFKKNRKYFSFLFIALLFVYLVFTIAYAESEEAKHFYFVQITDTHFSDADSLQRTRKIVERINNLPMKIECVVHTGDIVSDNINDETIVASGLSVLRGIKTPIHYVAGNHDILSQKPASTYKAYVENFGSIISQAEYENVIFIFIYTEPLKTSVSTEGYAPLEQLKTYLEKSKGKPVIIFHHTPSVDDFYNNKMHEGWKEDIREKWVKLINSYNVKAVIAGHFHRDEHHWLGEVPLYVSSSVVGYWGRQATFRIYEYKGGKLGYRTQYIE